MIKVDKQFDIDYIDCSGICEFNRCPAKYMMDRQMGVNAQDSMIIALDYGTDIHAAIPYCYNGGSSIDSAHKAFLSGWDKRKYEGVDKARNSQRARLTLLHFAETHTPAISCYEIIDIPDIKAETADIISPNEIPFLIDIGGELAFAGRIDAPVRHKGTDTLWALDYKTASEISDRYFIGFHNAPQTVGYTLALSNLFGKQVDGFIVEAIRTSHVRCENVTHLIFVNDCQIESFINFANDTAIQILECNENKKWHKKSSGCGPYSMFGSKGYPCPYLDICTSPDWKDMVRYYDTKEPFHPFKINR